MKIAILTWFSNYNYGTVLQLTALSDYLTSHCEATAEVIHYLPQEVHAVNKTETLGDHFFHRMAEAFNKKIRKPVPDFNALLMAEYPKEVQQKKQRFQAFLNRLAFTAPVSEIEELDKLGSSYDLLVCGSDQIWNPRILNCVFYLDFAHSVPRFSYAASLGINYIPEYAKKYIRRYLRDYRGVALREDTCRKEMEKLYGKPVDVVCDPVFLLDAAEWEALSAGNETPPEPYILNYYLGETPIHEDVLSAVTKTLKKPVRTLPSSPAALNRTRPEDVSAGPAEFLTLVRNAAFTVTDSFHAVCFCLIFKVPFCVVYKHRENDPFNQNSRISFLLGKLGLEDRVITEKNDAAAIAKTPIDFEKVDRLMETFIRQSKEYINRNTDI